MDILRTLFVDVGSAITTAMILGVFHGIFRLVRGVKKINQHLATLNGSVAKIKEQQYKHEVQDDIRHQQNVDRLVTNSELIHEVKGKVDALTKGGGNG